MVEQARQKVAEVSRCIDQTHRQFRHDIIWSCTAAPFPVQTHTRQTRIEEQRAHHNGFLLRFLCCAAQLASSRRAVGGLSTT